jgi:CRP-like cAMP-binding protein
MRLGRTADVYHIGRWPVSRPDSHLGAFRYDIIAAAKSLSPLLDILLNLSTVNAQLTLAWFDLRPSMRSKLTAGDIQIITRVAVFRGLKAETVEHIIAPATAVIVRPHEWIVRQDEPATAFFIVVDGWVKLYRSMPSGDDSVIEIMTKGDSFAEAVAFTGNRYMATAEAVSEARVVRIPADHIVRCIRKSPDIALGMIASISQHMHHLVQQVEQLKAQSGVQRVAEFLASLSSAEEGHCALALPYDKVLIAGRLGLKPESLSRAFARLRSIGVVVDASHVVVKDIAKLRQLAADDRGAVRDTLRPMHLREAG